MKDQYESKLGIMYKLKNAQPSQILKNEVDRVLMHIEFLIKTGEKLPYSIEVTKAVKEGCKVLDIIDGLEKNGVVIAPTALLRSYDEVFIKVIDFV